MNHKKVLERLDRKFGSDLQIRRYSLPDMISESYRTLYSCSSGTNMQRLVERHIEDVRSNPTDTDRLSRQLALIKKVKRMTESADLKDEELVPKEKYTPVEPPKEEEIKESAEAPEDEDLLEDTELTDEEVEELTKHLAELRKNNKKMTEECAEKPMDEEKSVEEEKPMEEAATGKGRPLKRRASAEQIEEGIFDSKQTKEKEYEKAIQDIFRSNSVAVVNKIAIAAAGLVSAATEQAEDDKDTARNAMKMIKGAKLAVKDSPLNLVTGIINFGRRYAQNDNNLDDLQEIHQNMRKLQKVEKVGYKALQYLLDKLAPVVLRKFDETAKFLKKEYGIAESLDVDDELEEARDFDWNDDLWAVVKEDGTYAGVPCRSYEEAHDLSYHPGSKIYKLTLDMDESTDLHEGKEYTILVKRKGREKKVTDTLEGLIDYFSYTLEKGKSYESEKGNKKIDKSPKTIAALIKNLNNAASNAAANGNPDTTYSQLKESASWDKVNLAKFRENSAGKAFMKTFKKLDSQLKEGSELSRQDTISLYKATNSVMTHLSVELEHNPEFLSTFKESVSLLSSSAAEVLDSLKEGKSPDKSTLQSLAKFVEALLREADEEEELPPVEEDAYVGAEDSDEATEEFNQEYAEARFEMHQELADEHAGESPEIDAQLAQDAEEVASLPGTTEEQAEELLGGSEESEESEEEIPAEEPEAEMPEETDESSEKDLDLGDDEELTDDELAELKKYLHEMRKARKNS